MSVNDKVLNQPTVKQIIELLSTYPPDTKFRLEDADAYSKIDIVHVGEIDDEVYFYGQYGEMNSKG